MNKIEINVGIDTSSKQLDIYVSPTDEFFSVSNDTDGIKIAIKRLQPLKPTRVLIESTGRLELDFVCTAHKAGLPIVFATQHKSGSSQKLQVVSLKPTNWMHIPKSVHKPIQNILKAIKKELQDIGKKLDKLVDSCADWRQRRDLLLSAKGVGNVLAYTLMRKLPELGKLNRKEVAALVDMAPMNRDSGSYEDKRYIRGERHKVRTVLFVSMMSAIQCHPKLKPLYQRMVAAGKPK